MGEIGQKEDIRVRIKAERRQSNRNPPTPCSPEKAGMKQAVEEQGSGELMAQDEPRGLQ